jgi:hypothetical protein
VPLFVEAGRPSAAGALFDSLPATVRRLKPAGPSDPGSAPDLLPVKHTVTLGGEDLAGLRQVLGFGLFLGMLGEWTHMK